MTGLIVGWSAERAMCIDCGRRLSAGDYVVAYTYWSEDAIDWEIGRLYCADCGLDGVPTPGFTEAIVTADLEAAGASLERDIAAVTNRDILHE